MIALRDLLRISLDNENVDDANNHGSTLPGSHDSTLLDSCSRHPVGKQLPDRCKVLRVAIQLLVSYEVLD